MAQIPEDWAQALAELERRRSAARAMGGAGKLAQRIQAGRRNARELVELLVDEGSFIELGTLVGGHSYHGETTRPADALVAGMARLDGRSLLIACEDFTVAGGSIGHGTAAKRLRLAMLARQEHCPLLLILDGAGARADNALERYPYAGNDLQELARLSGQVPTLALVLGSSAGHGVLSGMLCDLVVALEDATLFAAGPPLVEAALGEKVSKAELGAAAMHASVSGVVHNLVRDEDEACRLIRAYLAHLPASTKEYPPHLAGEDCGERVLEGILELVPRHPARPYDMTDVIHLLADVGEFLELQPLYGGSMIVGLLRLGGHPCLVVANQPAVLAGAISAEAATKATHFLRLAESYHLPVIFLADNPGVMSGTRAERAGTLRAAARMYAAQAALSSPKLHVTLRKAYGFGSSLMAMNPFDAQTLTLAFPGISLGGLPAGSGGTAAKLDAAGREHLAAAVADSAWSSADTMAYDEIIDPRQMRNALLRGLELALGRRRQNTQLSAVNAVDR
jgi:acetyl-CoA carboxylase carboxyltransferase component